MRFSALNGVFCFVNTFLSIFIESLNSCCIFVPENHHMESITLIALSIYLLTALITTYLLGNSLHQSGKAFIAECLPNEPNWHASISIFLLLGFYLINISFILFFLFSEEIRITSIAQAFEFCAIKLGKTYLILAAMHIHNIIGLLLYPQLIKQHPHGNI